MTNMLQRSHSYMNNPSTPVPSASQPASQQLSQQTGSSSSFPYRPSSVGAQSSHTDLSVFDGAARNEANTSKRRIRLANLMFTPPRRSHSTLSQEIFSNANSRISSPSPASFLPSADGSITAIPAPARRNISHAWSGRSTIPAKPSLSASTSSSSEWTDDDKFLTIRPPDDTEEAKRLISPRPGHRRYTAEKLPRPTSPQASSSSSQLGPTNTGSARRSDSHVREADIPFQTPNSPTKPSRFTPAATFSSIFKTSSSASSKSHSPKPQTPARPARFLALCKSKKPSFRSNSVGSTTLSPDDQENLAGPRAFSTPIADSPAAVQQLSPLSPNVEVLRGSARHRHRVQLAVEDQNPFGDLASAAGSVSDGEEVEAAAVSDGDDEAAFTMAPTSSGVDAYF